jgi:hypothetical protein
MVFGDKTWLRRRLRRWLFINNGILGSFIVCRPRERWLIIWMALSLTKNDYAEQPKVMQIRNISRKVLFLLFFFLISVEITSVLLPVVARRDRFCMELQVFLNNVNFIFSLFYSKSSDRLMFYCAADGLMYIIEGLYFWAKVRYSYFELAGRRIHNAVNFVIMLL